MDPFRAAKRGLRAPLDPPKNGGRKDDIPKGGSRGRNVKARDDDMAYFGANYPVFCPNGAAEGVVLGKLVGANLTVNLASGELYADDELAEQDRTFASGSLAMETDDMEDDVAATVYGATASGGVVTYRASDSAPMGKLAYIKSIMRSGAKLFKACFYPQVRAAVSNDNAQTKGNAINFATTSTTFTVFPDRETGEWRETKTFDFREAAVSWVNEMTNIAPGSARLLALIINDAGGAPIPLTPAFDPDVTAYTLETTAAASFVYGIPENGGASAAISLNGSAISENPTAAVWQTGENTLVITVTNGNVTKAYTVTVTKE